MGEIKKETHAMKSLVLAEKPSVARDIARVLGCRKNISGGMEGDHYVVTWALGHLITLADPEDYDKKYKEWKMEDLPMIPGKWDLTVIRQTSRQYSHVKALLFRKDIDQVIIATDPDSEGETTALYLADLLRGLVGQVTRIGYGVPLGGDIDYIDEMTLGYSLKGRTKL